MCETVKFFGVGGFGVLELVVDRAQLRPALGQRALARLGEPAALAGGLPLPEPERFALGPALGLVGVIVREQVVEIFQVAFERLFDDRKSLRGIPARRRQRPALRLARRTGPRCGGGRLSRRPTRACRHCRARRTPTPTRRGIVDSGEIRGRSRLFRGHSRVARPARANGAPSHHEAPVRRGVATKPTGAARRCQLIRRDRPVPKGADRVRNNPGRGRHRPGRSGSSWPPWPGIPRPSRRGRRRRRTRTPSARRRSTGRRAG